MKNQYRCNNALRRGQLSNVYDDPHYMYAVFYDAIPENSFSCEVWVLVSIEFTVFFDRSGKFMMPCILLRQVWRTALESFF